MNRRAPDGFTLLELLLAISLLSLITASIMGGVHLGRRSWDTSRASEALDEVENAVRAAAGLIGRGLPVAADQQQSFAAEPMPPFLGASERCRFVALSEGGAQWGGLILIEIAVEGGGEGAEIAVWTQAYRPREGLRVPRDAMKKTVVLKDVASFELSFYGAQQPGQPPGWSPAWNSRLGLPQLVAVTIRANRLGRVIEAMMTVAMRQR